MRSFIREKKIYCGDRYLEVDIYPYTDKQVSASKGCDRGKKEWVTKPKQRNLNDKNARRYFTQLSNANFDENDLHITATYKKEYLPDRIEDAERHAVNYLRRISYKRGRLGLAPLKYILVTECSEGRRSGKPVRIHHHIIMNGGLSRDTVEGLWAGRKQKGERIGFVNADRLQPDTNGLAALCEYLTKNPNRKKRWSSSQNLVKPFSRCNDTKYSRRQIEKLALLPPCREVWEKRYPGWTLADKDYGAVYEYNEQTGWAIYLKLRKLSVREGGQCIYGGLT